MVNRQRERGNRKEKQQQQQQQAKGTSTIQLRGDEREEERSEVMQPSLVNGGVVDTDECESECEVVEEDQFEVEREIHDEAGGAMRGRLARERREVSGFYLMLYSTHPYQFSSGVANV